MAKTIIANGNAQVDTAQAKFGTGSFLTDGVGDSLSTPDHADFDFGKGFPYSSFKTSPSFFICHVILFQ